MRVRPRDGLFVVCAVTIVRPIMRGMGVFSVFALGICMRTVLVEDVPLLLDYFGLVVYRLGQQKMNGEYNEVALESLVLKGIKEHQKVFIRIHY